MKQIKCLFLLWTIIILSSQILSAQANDISNQNTLNQDTSKLIFYYGLYGGYNFNIHYANFTHITSDCPTCVPNEYGTNIGGGIGAGLLFEYPLYSNDAKTPMSIGLRLGYSDRSVVLEQEEMIGNTLLDNSPVDALANHIFEVNLGQFDITPYFAYYFTDALVGNIGLNIGYLIKNSFIQREELITPESATYKENGQRVRNSFDDDIPNPNTLQFGVTAGVGYELKIGKWSRLMPELQYTFNFNGISSEVDWKSSILRLGIAAKFPIVSTPAPIPEIFYQRDTIIEHRTDITAEEIVLINTDKTLQGKVDTLISEHYVKYIPREATGNNSLTYYAIDNNGNKINEPTVVIEEFEKTESFPLLPVVYFNDGVKVLDKQTRMILYNTPDDVINFDENKLNDDLTEIYSNTLNILGKRMQLNTKSTIDIYGHNSGTGKDATDSKIATDRATEIKNYLSKVWGIASNRITVTSEKLKLDSSLSSYKDIVEETQSVRIASTDLDLLMPVILSDIEQIATPAQVIFDLNAEYELGIKNYSFDIEQDNRKLRNEKNDISSTNLNNTYTWEILDEPIPLLENPVKATFSYTTENNKAFDVHKDINIQQKTIKSKRVSIEGDYKIERYQLVLFEYNSANLTRLHNKILDGVKNSIHPNSELKISGYADRTGNIEDNSKLAQRRCESVQKLLNPNQRNKCKIEVAGSTPEKALYNNDLPENRAFSRTVIIEIRTPVK